MGVRAQNKKSMGFSLMEVVVAITITGLTVSTLAGTFLEIARTQHLLNGKVTAMIIGRGKLAELELGMEKSTAGTFDRPYERFGWKVSEEETENGQLLLMLEVKWREGSVKLDRVIFKETR